MTVEIGIYPGKDQKIKKKNCGFSKNRIKMSTLYMPTDGYQTYFNFSSVSLLTRIIGMLLE